MGWIGNIGLGRAAWRYFFDVQVAWWRKLTGLAAVAYVVWPLDLIPDGIPVIGWLDDIGVLSAAAYFVIREIRRHEQRALNAPIQPT